VESTRGQDLLRLSDVPPPEAPASDGGLRGPGRGRQ
jgi:hypothetical protein